jgi:methylmalonyl-CoA mutase
MIRGCLETAASILGGADVIATPPYDAVAGGPSRLGRRLARNTQLVLKEEARLGSVADPAGGSFFVEAATESLARAAWDELRAIEREGGVRRSLESGAFPERVKAARARADGLVATRRRVVVGVNNFVAAGDTLPPAQDDGARGPLAPVRVSEPFERLRRRALELSRRGDKPRALLVCLGAAKDYRAREEFSRRLLEAGGFEVDRDTGSGTDWIAEAVRRGGAPIAVVCSSDERYGELGGAAVTACKTGGAKAVVLAGKPGALEAALVAAGLHSHLHLGCDAVSALGALLDAAGGAS